MNRFQVTHVAGRYYVHPRVDVTREPTWPGDVAGFDIVAWELWADASQDTHGNWACDWLDDYETEAEAVAAARRLADADAVFAPHFLPPTP
ncbi:hypothetical protein [Paraburkholderia tropica]|uniref:hypothetical protein n=1 Tax=Paraburkholderia tropica TaxID=92647 RepID=UPI002AB7EE4A|nr:hypothetical protein [Paraburkholderia tropica]